MALQNRGGGGEVKVQICRREAKSKRRRDRDEETKNFFHHLNTVACCFGYPKVPELRKVTWRVYTFYSFFQLPRGDLKKIETWYE